MHQDELPGETWDSFESSDYYENVDSQQMHAESAATSTTKTIILQPGDGKSGTKSGHFKAAASPFFVF